MFGWKDVISVAALLISVITAYLTLFRRGRLQPRFGKVMLLQYQGDGRIHFKIELSVQNPGARVAVIYDIAGELRRLSDDTREPLIWQLTLTTEFDPETHGNDTRFKSLPETLFIAKTEAVKERLQFQTQKPYSFTPGDYEIEVSIRSDGTARSKTGLKSELRVSAEDIAFLEEYRTSQDGPKKQKNLYFLLERPSAKSTRFVSRLQALRT